MNNVCVNSALGILLCGSPHQRGLAQAAPGLQEEQLLAAASTVEDKKLRICHKKYYKHEEKRTQEVRVLIYR